MGVYGYATATTGSNYGVYGRSASAAGRGVYGYATTNTGITYGVYGQSASTSGRGVYGLAVATIGTAYGGMFETGSSSGTGVSGNALAYSGTTYGVYGQSASTSSRGVYGYASATTGTTYGVFGESYSTDGFGVYYAGGLAGTGTKSCVVKTSQGPTLLYCQESPENWFEDFGEGQFTNGKAQIALDGLFLETVTIDGQNPMKVFIAPNENIGPWWIEKGIDSFTVRAPEAAEGAQFDYRVVAKRKGFEAKRLDYCKAAESDTYFYPELREKEQREQKQEQARIE